MKKILLLIGFLIVVFIVNGQTDKSVVITKKPKTVPVGKKWILDTNIPTRVQVSYGVLNSGSICNSFFLSTPHMISNINKGDIYDAESYMLMFKDYEKIPYSNKYSYYITIISIADKDFSLSDLKNRSPKECGVNNLQFIAGESVFVGNCLESIELKEVNMSQIELLEVKKKEDEINNTKRLKLQNFNIPIDPEKYVEPNTKPKIHDSKLENIVFSSSSVLYKSNGKGYAFDDVSTWTLNLNIDNFIIKSSNGINKTYFVIKIEYDKEMNSQKFILGNSNNEITHELLISWNNSMKEYSLIFSSIDNSEEFQFQEIKSIKKQYQNK